MHGVAGVGRSLYREGLRRVPCVFACLPLKLGEQATHVSRLTVDESLPEGVMAYRESFVRRDQHRIRVREYPGEEPAIILMHGFPDNLHLYDRLFAYLSPPRRVIAFDFLGWGGSDKPLGFPYTASSQVDDLDAVITQLRLSASSPCRTRRLGSACDRLGARQLRAR